MAADGVLPAATRPRGRAAPVPARRVRNRANVADSIASDTATHNARLAIRYPATEGKPVLRSSADQ